MKSDRSNLPAFAAAFGSFAKLLDLRLGQGVHTSEDAVRYTLFLAIVDALRLTPDRVVLEKPHPRIPRAMIDTFIVHATGRSTAIEFKYDRPIPSRQSLPLSQKAGSVLKDIFRLAHFEEMDDVDGIFVYLTSNEMAKYLANPRNGLMELFDLPLGSAIDIDEEFLSLRSATLRNSAGVCVSCRVQMLFSRALSAMHYLRIYHVARQ